MQSWGKMNSLEADTFAPPLSFSFLFGVALLFCTLDTAHLLLFPQSPLSLSLFLPRPGESPRPSSVTDHTPYKQATVFSSQKEEHEKKTKNFFTIRIQFEAQM